MLLHFLFSISFSGKACFPARTSLATDPAKIRPMRFLKEMWSPEIFPKLYFRLGGPGRFAPERALFENRWAVAGFFPIRNAAERMLSEHCSTNPFVSGGFLLGMDMDETVMGNPTGCTSINRRAIVDEEIAEVRFFSSGGWADAKPYCRMNIFTWDGTWIEALGQVTQVSGPGRTGEASRNPGGDVDFSGGKSERTPEPHESTPIRMLRIIPHKSRRKRGEAELPGTCIE